MVRKVVLSGLLPRSGTAGSSSTSAEQLKLHAKSEFQTPDYLGLTFDLYRIFEGRPEVTVEKAAVFANPGHDAPAVVFVEVETSSAGLVRLVSDAEGCGIPLETAKTDKLKGYDVGYGWWRPRPWENCGSMVMECRVDPKHAEMARLAGPASARAAFPNADEIADREHYGYAYQPGTRYLDTSFSEIFYKAGFNILGWVATPFDKGVRRRIEVVFEHPSILGCPLRASARPFGLGERLQVLSLYHKVDFLEVFDLNTPGDVG